MPIGMLAKYRSTFFVQKSKLCRRHILNAKKAYTDLICRENINVKLAKDVCDIRGWI